MNKELSLWIFKENKKYPPHICPRVPPRCQTVTFHRRPHTVSQLLSLKNFFGQYLHTLQQIMNYCLADAKVRISRKNLQAWHKKTSIFVLKISRKIHLKMSNFLGFGQVLQKNFGFGLGQKKTHYLDRLYLEVCHRVQHSKTAVPCWSN